MGVERERERKREREKERKRESEKARKREREKERKREREKERLMLELCCLDMPVRVIPFQASRVFFIGDDVGKMAHGEGGHEGLWAFPRAVKSFRGWQQVRAEHSALQMVTRVCIGAWRFPRPPPSEKTDGQANTRLQKAKRELEKFKERHRFAPGPMDFSAR